MAWNDYGINEYGLEAPAPNSQATPLALASTYASGGVPATSLSGQVVNTLQVGGGSNSDLAVYIDEQGIHIGNAVFSAAPFSVDMNGELVASDATIVAGSSGGEQVVISSDSSGGYFTVSVGGVVVGKISVGGSVGNPYMKFVSSTGTTRSEIDLFPTGAGGLTMGTFNTSTGAGVQMTLSTNMNQAEFVVGDGTNTAYYQFDSVAPTVTGSQGGNAALGSLITALAGIDLVVDGTTP